MQFRFIFNVSGHFHAWPVLLLLMRPQGISVPCSSLGTARTFHMLRFGHNFHAETIHSRPSRAWPAGRAASCLLLSSFWAARLLQGAGQAKVYGYKWSPHFLTAAFPNNCRTKNNNFSADVIFISTYVAAAWRLSQRSAKLPPSWSPRVCVCVCVFSVWCGPWAW